MTIRFSKAGKWYKLGDKLPGGVNSLMFCHRRNGVSYGYSGPHYDEATGVLNEYDNMVKGIFFGGVLHPFVTLDNSGTRGAMVAPIQVLLDENVIGDFNAARRSTVNENLVFKKISATQWQSEKSFSEMDITVIAGSAPTGKINLTYMNLTNYAIPAAYRGWGWRAEIADGMSIMILVNDPFVTHAADLTTYLIKVIA